MFLQSFQDAVNKVTMFRGSVAVTADDQVVDVDDHFTVGNLDSKNVLHEALLRL